ALRKLQVKARSILCENVIDSPALGDAGEDRRIKPGTCIPFRSVACGSGQGCHYRLEIALRFLENDRSFETQYHLDRTYWPVVDPSSGNLERERDIYLHPLRVNRKVLRLEDVIQTTREGRSEVKYLHPNAVF